MSFLQNAKIRTKILSLVLPICLLGIGAALLLAHQFKTADTAYYNFINHENAAATDMARAARNMAAIPYRAYQILANSKDTPEMAAAVAGYKDETARVLPRLESVKTKLPSRAAEVDSFAKRVRDIIVITDQAVKFGINDQNEEAKKLLFEADLLLQPLIQDTRTWQDMLMTQVATDSDRLTSATDRTIFYSLLLIGLIFSAGVLAAFIITARGITTPIARLRERMTALVAGDTAAEIDGYGRRDEVGQMAAAVMIFRDNAVERLRLEQEADTGRSASERNRLELEAQKARETAEIRTAVEGLAAGLQHLSNGDVAYRIEQRFAAHLDILRENFNVSVARLQTALQAVGDNAHAIDAGANEIRSAAEDLSRRTEQQAASVEETAAALEQITTTVKDSSRRAEEAGQLVGRTREGAEGSGQIVREAVAAMQEIERSSREITNIIGVIDDIAFQTNLLALNAGVEAARAGDAGKGFAVVAQEVRELAQRSAGAAKEIKALINTSGAQVRNGVTLVGQTGNALEVIVTEVQEINRHVSAIVEAAREQSTALHEISSSVNTIDQGTQKNAEMVEEQTAASHSLAKEAASLNHLLSQFNLGQNHQTAAAPAARPAPRAVPSQSHANAHANAHATAHNQTPARVSRPAPSPARELAGKVARAFTGNAAPQDSWEEF
jgi:methyl-accepting chemotaxis protein